MSSRVIVKIGTKSYDTLKEKRYQFLTYLRGLNTNDVKFLNQNTVSTMPNHGADFQWNEQDLTSWHQRKTETGLSTFDISLSKAQHVLLKP